MRAFLLDLAIALALGASVYAATVYLLEDIEPPRQEAR